MVLVESPEDLEQYFFEIFFLEMAVFLMTNLWMIMSAVFDVDFVLHHSTRSHLH